MSVKLIILTYMRSGSSFTGDLFNQHPDVFYVYEPLWAIQKHFRNNSAYPAHFFAKGPALPVPSHFYNPTSLSAATMKAFLDCDLYSLDPSTLSQGHHQRSLTTKPFFQCHKKEPSILGALRCLPLLFRACRAAKVVTTKTIRFTMAQAAHLMKKDPKIKVIHLVRDPRATLRSQAVVGEFKRENIKEAASSLCSRVMRDVQEAGRLKLQKPGRVLSARYEDLAMEPLTFAKKLLSFAGLSFGEGLRQYVWNITSAGLPNDCIICTTRNSSRRTAQQWRQLWGVDVTGQVDAACKEVYRVAGYLPLPTQRQLKDLSVPSFVNSSKMTGWWG